MNNFVGRLMVGASNISVVTSATCMLLLKSNSKQSEPNTQAQPNVPRVTDLTSWPPVIIWVLPLCAGNATRDQDIDKSSK